MSKELDKAIALFREYKLDELRELLEKIVESDSENLEALTTLGKIHSRTQNYGEAINIFNSVLKIDKDNTEARTNLKLIQNILQLTNNFYFENAYTDDGLYDFE